MGIVDTFMLRLRPDLSYMTEAEGKLFKRLRKDNALSFFRVAKCKNCGKETAKSKEFCSKECWEKGGK